MPDGTFGLVDPFDIDDGQLDGLMPQQVFTLGVEWEMVRARMDADESFSHLIHSENRDRIAAMASRRGRVVRFTAMHDDVSEAWLTAHID